MQRLAQVALALSIAALSCSAYPFASLQQRDLNTNGSLRLFIDFDGTIATSDAYSTFAYAAYESLPANSSIPPWDDGIEVIYGQVYDAASANISEPTSLQEAIEYSNNAVLAGVEGWSFYWVQHLGLFNTAEESNLIRYAKNVTLREGWCDFLQQATDQNIQVNVISLNWSPSWIRLVMQEASTCRDLVENVAVYCPEILPAGILPSSKLNYPSFLFSGGDKTTLVKQLLRNQSLTDDDQVVFVSDGQADLSPLFEKPTSIGIAAGADGSAYEAFQAYNITILPVTDGFQGKSGQAGNNDTVYSMESWTDVARMLFSNSTAA